MEATLFSGLAMIFWVGDMNQIYWKLLSLVTDVQKSPITI
jgi:hypothetical protein